MSGTAFLNTLDVLNYKVGIIIVPSFYMNKLMQREVKQFAQRHLTSSGVKLWTQAVWAHIYIPNH